MLLFFRVSPKNSYVDVFGLLSDNDLDVENLEKKQRPQQLESSLTTKVANGNVQRAARITGPYYVEVRVYLTRDALKAKREERYKKSLTTVKLQLADDSPEFAALQKFMKSCHKRFSDKEPVFYCEQNTLSK